MTESVVNNESISLTTEAGLEPLRNPVAASVVQAAEKLLPQTEIMASPARRPKSQATSDASKPTGPRAGRRSDPMQGVTRITRGVSQAVRAQCLPGVEGVASPELVRVVLSFEVLMRRSPKFGDHTEHRMDMWADRIEDWLNDPHKAGAKPPLTGPDSKSREQIPGDDAHASLSASAAARAVGDDRAPTSVRGRRRSAPAPLLGRETSADVIGPGRTEDESLERVAPGLGMLKEIWFGPIRGTASVRINGRTWPALLIIQTVTARSFQVLDIRHDLDQAFGDRWRAMPIEDLDVSINQTQLHLAQVHSQLRALVQSIGRGPRTAAGPAADGLDLSDAAQLAGAGEERPGQAAALVSSLEAAVELLSEVCSDMEYGPMVASMIGASESGTTQHPQWVTAFCRRVSSLSLLLDETKRVRSIARRWHAISEWTGGLGPLLPSVRETTQAAQDSGSPSSEALSGEVQLSAKQIERASQALDLLRQRPRVLAHALAVLIATGG